MKKLVIFFFVMVMLLSLSSCYATSYTSIDGKIHDYGNGVYYFSFVGDDFGEQLSIFIEKNKGKAKVVSVTSFDHESYGKTCGFFVVMEENK
jgi:hypothetical protein